MTGENLAAFLPFELTTTAYRRRATLFCSPVPDAWPIIVSQYQPSADGFCSGRLNMTGHVHALMMAPGGS